MARYGTATDLIRTRLAELQVAIDVAEPGTLSATSETVLMLEFYLHWLPAAEQRDWFETHGEVLRRAVFG